MKYENLKFGIRFDLFKIQNLVDLDAVQFKFEVKLNSDLNLKFSISFIIKFRYI